MTYHQDGNIKLKQQHIKQAVTLAMQGKWRDAVAANKLIIENFPKDVAAYNRLGRARMELGEYDQAKDAYQQALDLDPYNTIARKNLDRLSHLEGAQIVPEADHHAEPQIFIEEIGKAGIVNLEQMAAKEILAKITSGDMVNLKIADNNLIAENSFGDYLGEVAPKHAHRLIKLMQGGNKYTAAIVSSAEGKVTVIIRETYHDPSQAGQLSFPPKRFRTVRPYTGEKIIRAEAEYEEEPEESADTEVYDDSASVQE